MITNGHMAELSRLWTEAGDDWRVVGRRYSRDLFSEMASAGLVETDFDRRGFPKVRMTEGGKFETLQWKYRAAGIARSLAEVSCGQR